MLRVNSAPPKAATFAYLKLLMSLFFLSFISSQSYAQKVDERFNLDEAAVEADKKVDLNTLGNGWHLKADLGANFSFGSSSNVIGQVSGDTTTLGANTDSQAIYIRNQHKWRNRFNFLAATQNNPNLKRWLKTNDEVKLNSIYLYKLEQIPWLGPYAQASIQTVAFEGRDLRNETVNYAITDTTGNVTQQAGTELKLTDPFKPLRTKQSVGAFAKAIDKKDTQLEFRLGGGALQVSADNQLVLNDDSTTSDVEVTALRSFSQAGLEGGVTYSQKLDEKTSLAADFEFLTPFISQLQEGDNRSSTELTNWELSIKLMTKIYSWASLNYEFRTLKQPQLLDRVQTQHMMVLNFTHSLGE